MVARSLRRVCRGRIVGHRGAARFDRVPERERACIRIHPRRYADLRLLRARRAEGHPRRHVPEPARPPARRRGRASGEPPHRAGRLDGGHGAHRRRDRECAARARRPLHVAFAREARRDMRGPKAVVLAQLFGNRCRRGIRLDGRDVAGLCEWSIHRRYRCIGVWYVLGGTGRLLVVRRSLSEPLVSPRTHLPLLDLCSALGIDAGEVGCFQFLLGPRLREQPIRRDPSLWSASRRFHRRLYSSAPSLPGRAEQRGRDHCCVLGILHSLPAH